MIVLETYTDIFLLYLLTRFASESSGAQMQDVMLGKKVPCFVFIMNQRLLAEAIKNQTALDRKAKERLRQQAQANEYLYSLMSELGVTASLDRSIGAEFIE